jgi:RNA polymerase sigma-70 factor (ECF subfamily)
MKERSLAESVGRAQRGDQEAFRVLFDALHDRLFGYASAHVRSRESASDLVQETLVDLWKELPRFRYQSDGKFYSFVFLILKRKLAKHYGKEARAHESLDERQEILGDTDDAIAVLPEYEDHRRLMKAFEMLSETSKEILSLRNWSDLSFKEIAETLNIGESAAKVRHHRAINELREILIAQGYI